jgi:carbonic anhydrase
MYFFRYGGVTLRSTIAIRQYVASAILIALAWGVPLAGFAADDEAIHWTYAGERGPEHWGELSEVFEACSDGRNQSPIDIVDPIQAELGSIGLSYRGSTNSITNNGHTLEIKVGPDNTLTVDGKKYSMSQFHVHSPSEHRIEGESFPLEAHFVHQSNQGEIAVVSVLFREGSRNEGLGLLGASAPGLVGESAPIDARIVDLGLVPAKSAYYRYSGSLTTPPCTEGILWLVLKTTGSISREQVAAFVEAIGEDARDPQPLNGRLVVH